MIIGLPGDSPGFGDLFTITPICKAVPDCIVNLHHNSKRFSRIFEGICKEIRLVENPIETKGDGRGDHWSKQKLRTLGLPDNDYLSLIHI